MTDASKRNASTLNPLEMVRDQLRSVQKHLRLSPAAYEFLTRPQVEHCARIPLRTDAGEIQGLRGFRVQWNLARGVGKGGIRFHPAETLETVRALGAWMTWKTAVMGLPLGGAKGGVVCDPRDLSGRELEGLCRGYIRVFARQMGPHIDVGAPDVGTGGRMMAWMEDEYRRIQHGAGIGVVTGKPVPFGGSVGRVDATARGGMHVLLAAAESAGHDLAGHTVAIQGYGNVGSHAHRLAEKMAGLKILAVSDSQGGIYKEDGLEYEAVQSCKQRTGSVVNFSRAERIDNAGLLELEVDLLIPAAIEGVLHGGNAANVRASWVAEFANGPTTPEADEVFRNRGIRVLPDFLCNAGGVTVSYFEQIQNATGEYWDLDAVHTRLEQRMRSAYKAVDRLARERGVPLRVAAYILAVGRVHRAMQLRGWV